MLKELKVSESWRVLGKMAVCHKKIIIISTSLGMKKERQKGKGSRVGDRRLSSGKGRSRVPRRLLKALLTVCSCSP